MGHRIGLYIAGLTLVWGAAAWAGPLVWVTDDTPGGHFIVGSGPRFAKENPGVEIELYRMVARKLDLDIRLERHPWNHCLYMIEHNQVDGIFPASFTPERLKIGAFPMKGDKVDSSRKTRDNAYFLYKLKADPLGWNGESFVHVSGRIGVPEGWRIAGDLKSKYGFISQETIDEKTPNLLVYGRLQGYVCLETVFDEYLSRQTDRFKAVVKVQPPVSEKPNYLMLSHKFVTTRPGQAKKIWDTIRTVKNSREYARLTHKYFR